MIENAFPRAALALASALLLAGCGNLFSAEVQDSSVALTRDFPGLPGTGRLPGAPAGPVDVPAAVTLPPASGTFNADIPLSGKSQGGTFQVTTLVTLNGADVAMSATSGDLAGVSAAVLKVYDASADPSGSQAQTIATYTRPTAGPSDPTRIHLVKSGDVNLADDLADQKMGLQLVLTVQGTVNFPQQDWSAALTLDFYVDSKAEGP